MGTETKVLRFTSCDKNELRDLVNQEIDNIEQDSGTDGYNGTWGGLDDQGLDITDKTFTDHTEAYDWLSDNCQKRGPLACVKVFRKEDGALSKSGTKKAKAMSDKIRNAYDKSNELRDKINDMLEGVVKRTKQSKSTLKTCRSCTSKIATKYIKGHHCPVCLSDFYLLTATDSKRLSSMRIKIGELLKLMETTKKERTAMLEKEISKGKTTDSWYWLVGGNCAS